MNKKKQTLAVLGLIFIMALAYAYWATPRQQRVTEREAETPPRKAKATRQVEAVGETGHLKVDLLQRQPEKFPGYARNIFRFARVRRPTPPPPPPKPKKVVKEPVKIETPKVPIGRELARFTFLGFLKKDSTRTIFLSSDDTIFLVKKGDHFGENGKFFVADLTDEVLTIRQGDDPRVITVPLIERTPLVPRF